MLHVVCVCVYISFIKGNDPSRSLGLIALPCQAASAPFSFRPFPSCLFFSCRPSVQFYKGEPLMEKDWYDVSNKETAGRHSRYLRSYRNLMEEAVVLLSGGRRDRLAELDDMLAFETQFAKV